MSWKRLTCAMIPSTETAWRSWAEASISADRATRVGESAPTDFGTATSSAAPAGRTTAAATAATNISARRLIIYPSSFGVSDLSIKSLALSVGSNPERRLPHASFIPSIFHPLDFHLQYSLQH